MRHIFGYIVLIGLLLSYPAYTMFVGGELESAEFEKLASDPAGSDARVYYNTGSGAVKYYDGSDFVPVVTSPMKFDLDLNGSDIVDATEVVIDSPIFRPAATATTVFGTVSAKWTGGFFGDWQIDAGAPGTFQLLTGTRARMTNSTGGGSVFEFANWSSVSTQFADRGSVDLGTVSKEWQDIHLDNETGSNVSIDTANDSTADATATDSITITSGNKTAGTGDSGPVILTTGTSTGGSRGNVQVSAPSLEVLADGTVTWTNSSGSVDIKANAATATYSMTWPENDGDSNQVLTTDGAGVLRWDAATASSFPLQGPADSAAAPNYSWTAATDTGMYNVSGTTIGLSTSGAFRLTVADAAVTAAVPIELDNAGDVSAPDLSFDGDEDTGIFQTAAGMIEFATNGVFAGVFDFNSNSSWFNVGDQVSPAGGDDVVHLHDDAGTEGVWVRTTNGDTGSGSLDGYLFGISSSEEPTLINYEATDQVWRNNNTEEWMRFDDSLDQIHFRPGSASHADTIGVFENSTVWAFFGHNDNSPGEPAYTFNGDTDTGMFRSGTNIVAFSTAGTEAFAIGTSVAITRKGLDIQSDDDLIADDDVFVGNDTGEGAKVGIDNIGVFTFVRATAGTSGSTECAGHGNCACVEQAGVIVGTDTLALCSSTSGTRAYACFCDDF